MDPHTQYQMANIQETLKQLSEQQQRMMQEAQRRQQEAAAEKMIETLVKILSSSYDKSVAYNNVLIVAGYAAFFAIWGATKPALTNWISIASALLMVTSATVFVLFELFKMVHSSRAMTHLQSIAADESARKNPEVLQLKMKEYEAAQRLGSLRFLRIWVVVLAITASTGVLAVGLLAYNYVCILITGGQAT